MKKLFSCAFMVCFLVGGLTAASFAQKKANEPQLSAYSGPIVKKRDPSQGAKLSNLFNMKMRQSFSVNMGALGGHLMNTEAFTNSMFFFFNPKLTGRVDVSLLTHPFGLNHIYGFSPQRKLQVALNAQLKYQITKNMDIRLDFNRAPGGYGYFPGSYLGGYGFPYRYFSPFFER